MTDAWPLVSAAFITGLLGSAHCFGMCGGISGLFAVNANVASLKTQMSKAIAYNAGRVLTYAVLGIVVAVLGKTMVASIPRLAAPVRFASGALIVLVGLQLAFDLRILSPVENAGARLWRKVAPAAKALVPVETHIQALGLGLPAVRAGVQRSAAGGDLGRAGQRRTHHDRVRARYDARHDSDRCQCLEARAVHERKTAGGRLADNSPRYRYDCDARDEVCTIG